MNQDLSILHLVLNASCGGAGRHAAAGAGVGGQLGGHFSQAVCDQAVKALNETFEREFWSGTSLNDLFAAATKNARESGPMERIFASGMREYQKLRERRITDTGTLMDGARRAMRASFQREMDEVESTCPSWPRSVRSRRMSGCSARCGASCMPSPGWPTCSR
jgi:biopolymer transport protein TolQ